LIVMTTAEIIFVALVTAILLIWAAWVFAPRDNRFMQSWIGLTGRRTAGPPSIGADSDDDRRKGAPRSK
jgi:hypothetical protein